jgi:4,5-DOPA dioxygenase extradiol
MSAQPALFVPHGSPMFALQPGAAGVALRTIAGTLTRPRVIVIVSPHWETPIPTVGSATTLRTIHDFSGFDRRLYDLSYPATGCPTAALEVAEALRAADLEVVLDETRGLDHGAWVPLRHMFPDADVPVVPLSIQHHEGPAFAYAVGQAISPLLERGFLVIGSGNITHNLRDWQTAMQRGGIDADYAKRFSDWVENCLNANAIDDLLDYRRLQADGVRAHPRDEHLLPLFTALGAGGPDAKGNAFHRGLSEFVLAMDGYIFQPGERS